MDEHQLVAVVVVRRVPAGVLDQVRDAEDRNDGDEHQRVGHRQHLQRTTNVVVSCAIYCTLQRAAVLWPPHFFAA